MYANYNYFLYKHILCKLSMSIQWEEQVYSSREVAEMKIFMQILVSCAKLKKKYANTVM